MIWAAFGLVGLLVLVSGALVFGSIFYSPVSDTAVRSMIEGRIISRAIVLFLIIPTIAILCLEDKISGEATIAALSAITGYILGGATGSNTTASSTVVNDKH
jgi:hypothetical protein